MWAQQQIAASAYAHPSRLIAPAQSVSPTTYTTATTAPQVLNLECPDRLVDRGFSAQRDIVAFADSTGLRTLIQRAVQLTCQHREGREVLEDDLALAPGGGGDSDDSGGDDASTRKSQGSAGVDGAFSSHTRTGIHHTTTRPETGPRRSPAASASRLQEEDFAWEQGGDGGFDGDGDSSRAWKRKATQQSTLGFSVKKSRPNNTPRVRVSPWVNW